MNPETLAAMVTAMAEALKLAGQIMEDRRQSGELTKVEEEAWDAYVQSRETLPHWKTSQPK